MPQRSNQARSLPAIAMAGKLGLRIQSEYAHVVELYRRFTPLSKMVEELGLIETYGVSERIARSAVEYALRGYAWGNRVESYDGLITDPDELARIVSGYRKQTGQRLRKQKLGICGQTKEEQRKACNAGAKAHGWILFTKRETESALRLCTYPRFCYDSGPHKGKPRLELVAQELNRQFHKGQPVRDKYSVNFLRGRAKRQQTSS